MEEGQITDIMFCVPFSALTLMVGWQQGRLAHKRSDSYVAQLTQWPDQRALQSWKWPMVLQRKLRPSNIARVNVQLDPRYAASKHTTAAINYARLLPRKHSPDVATHARKQTSDYSSLLNLSTWKG